MVCPDTPLVRQVMLVLVAAVCGVCALAAQPAAATSVARERATDARPAAAPPRTLVVPSVVGHAFVFAKGELDDAGFAWRVVGAVHGYAANVVVRQQPAPGIRVLDTGSPLIAVELRVDPTHRQAGTPENRSSWAATRLVRVR